MGLFSDWSGYLMSFMTFKTVVLKKQPFFSHFCYFLSICCQILFITGNIWLFGVQIRHKCTNSKEFKKIRYLFTGFHTEFLQKKTAILESFFYFCVYLTFFFVNLGHILKITRPKGIFWTNESTNVFARWMVILQDLPGLTTIKETS